MSSIYKRNSLQSGSDDYSSNLSRGHHRLSVTRTVRGSMIRLFENDFSILNFRAKTLIVSNPKAKGWVASSEWVESVRGFEIYRRVFEGQGAAFKTSVSLSVSFNTCPLATIHWGRVWRDTLGKERVRVKTCQGEDFIFILCAYYRRFQISDRAILLQFLYETGWNRYPTDFMTFWVQLFVISRLCEI